MSENIIINSKKIIILTISLLLIIISITLLLYNKIVLITNEVKESVSSQIFLENMKNTNQESTNVIIDTSYINDPESENNPIVNSKKSNMPILDYNKEYLGYLKIKKINLNYGFVDINSDDNDVNKNIEVLSISDYPDVDKGNLIIAGHSGTSSKSYFRYLYCLKVGDEAIVYYKNKIYIYRMVNVYYENRDGALDIYRNFDQTTLTLITCDVINNKKLQSVQVFELIGIEGGDNNE